MTHRRNAFALAAILVASQLTGCAKDPSKDVATAKVEATKGEAKQAVKPEAANAAPTAAPTGATAAPTGATAAPTAGSIALSGQVDFIGSKVTANHECTFKDWTGTISLKNGKVEGGNLSLTVQTGSVIADYKKPNAWSVKLEGHMKSCDFFCVEKHPTATFASKSITAKAGDKGATHEIAGDLSIRGTTKAVTFAATLAVSDKEVTGTAAFSIMRKDFGIVYPGAANDLIRPAVVLKISLRGAR